MLVLSQKDIKVFNTQRYNEVLSFYMVIILLIATTALGLRFRGS
jgi:hypothetical protein